VKTALLLATSLGALVLVTVAAACASGSAAENGGMTPVSVDESRTIAREYVIGSPTFQYDGMEDTLVLARTETLRCPYCWEFEFEFDCRHPGYGDRTGLVLLQVVTPHTARVKVSQGEVTDALLDGTWNMIQQRYEFRQSEEPPMTGAEALNLATHIHTI
jgi:hypothetical protein